MTILRDYVGASSEDAVFADECSEQANALVTAFIGDAVIPEEVRSRAVIEAGSELYHKRSAPNGISQFAAFDGSATRVARDPMVAAYSILKPYLSLGFA